MQFNIETTPFSLRGSWLAFGKLPAPRAAELGKEPGVFLRTLRGSVAMDKREIFRLRFYDADGIEPLVMAETAGPASCLFTGPRGATAEILFSDPATIRVIGGNCVLRLDADTGAYDYARPAGPGSWELNLYTQRCRLMLRTLQGKVEVQAPWHEQRSLKIQLQVQPGAEGGWDIQFEEFFAVPSDSKHPATPAVIRSEVHNEFARFLNSLPQVPQQLDEARELAGYILWTSLVSKGGILQREGMLMSKNWMVNIWSWDHCFNAIALASGHPRVAWNQFAVMFDHQHASGALPDSINDREIVWNFTKPPVHGWAFREMIAHGFVPDPAQTEHVAKSLEKQVDWWMIHRDDDHDGLPQYNHGNDSGWDNATCFGAGMPVEGPDLAAFLIVTMDVLADLHQRVGDATVATAWMRRADHLTRALIDHSWRGDRFIAPRSGDHVLAEGDSLVNFMPLLIGKRLPKDILDSLLAGLRKPGRFITDHGLATESPLSPLYLPDGYWRGPVWAPSTHLIVSALTSLGEQDLARDISARFCRAFAKSGSAENFDALTGAGLRDRAYTWTASVFLSLASTLV